VDISGRASKKNPKGFKIIAQDKKTAGHRFAGWRKPFFCPGRTSPPPVIHPESEFAGGEFAFRMKG
jgi:hypothetical protein